MDDHQEDQKWKYEQTQQNTVVTTPEPELLVLVHFVEVQDLTENAAYFSAFVILGGLFLSLFAVVLCFEMTVELKKAGALDRTAHVCVSREEGET